MTPSLWHHAPLTLLLLARCASAPSEARAPEPGAPEKQPDQVTAANAAPAPVDVAPAWQDDDPSAGNASAVDPEPAEPTPKLESPDKPCIRVDGKCFADTTGVDECDQYFATVISCKGMPEAAQEAMKDAATTMADNVKQASEPQARKAFAEACRTAREALTGCQ